MGWYDRVSSWVDRLVEQTWGLHDMGERHFHAFGLHGPYTRHLVKTRVAPAILLGGTMLLVLATALVIRRSRARRRRRDPPGAAPPARPGAAPRPARPGPCAGPAPGRPRPPRRRCGPSPRTRAGRSRARATSAR